MAETLRGRVGRWCVEAHLQLAPEARPVTINAVSESRLVGGRWLLTEMRGPGFEGVGLNGYDAATGRYTGYWVDGTRGFTIPVEGDYDAGLGRVPHGFDRKARGRRAHGRPLRDALGRAGRGGDPVHRPGRAAAGLTNGCVSARGASKATPPAPAIRR